CARFLAALQALGLGQTACRIPAPGHRRPAIAGRTTGAGLRGSHHLLRPASRRQPGLSGGARGIPRVLLPGTAVARAGRPRRAGSDLPRRHAGTAEGRCTGGPHRVPHVLSAVAVRPVVAGSTGLRVEPVATTAAEAAEALLR